MVEEPPRGQVLTAWALFVGWAALIYASIPFARGILQWTELHGGAGSMRWLSIALIGLAAAWAIRRILRRLRHLRWPRIALVVFVAAVFVYLAFEMMDTPAEALHFVEYGVLGLLAFRAFAMRGRDPLVYLNAALACALVSTIDEAVQWMTPGRYWDVRDLSNNSLAAALVLVAVAGGFRPAYIRLPIARESARMTAALAAVLALLLGVCAANTPVAAARLAERIPALTFLLNNEHAMSEYGYRYEEPDIGRFYSRFDADTVRAIDSARAAEVGAILHYYTVADSFTNFLRVYTPARDPFAHEAMVRLNRRNHYFGVLPKYRDEPYWYAFHVTIAWRENQILERYFSNTLAAAGQYWTHELKEALAEHVQDRRYTSPVSRHLIHRVSLPQVWLLIGVIWLGCAAVWRASGNMQKRNDS